MFSTALLELQCRAASLQGISGGGFARYEKSAKASAVWGRVIPTEAQSVWLEKIVVVICSTVQ